jgi:ribonuclease HII
LLKAFFDKNLLEAGCDEAGRGCLAGPVFAAAVIFNKKYRNKNANIK